MRSNFAPRLGVRRESVFDVLERHGRRGRLVGIAHLLDPFADHTCARSPRCSRPSGSTTRCARRPSGWWTRRTPTCSFSSCSRPTRSATCAARAAASTSTSWRRRDRHVEGFLDFLAKPRQARRRHRDPDGRPRPGARHRRPRPPRLGRAPGAVRGLGRGRGAGGGVREPRSMLELAATVSRRCSAWRRRRPRAAGRSCRRSTPDVEPAGARGPLPGDRRGARRGADARMGAVGPPAAGLRPAARRAGRVDDGSRDGTRGRGAGGRRPGGLPRRARAGSAPRCAPAWSCARERGYAAAVYLDGDGEYDPAELERRARARGDAGAPTTCSAPASSGSAGWDVLAPLAGQPRWPARCSAR